MHRVVREVKWAELRDEGPGFGVKRARGAKAAGLRYERALAKALPGARHGQWIEFFDANGHGWAQCDFLLSRRGELVVLEAKYSWVVEGHLQLELLYLPLLEKVLGQRPLGIVVCKNLTPTSPRASAGLDDAIARARRGGRSVLHWIGVGPLSLAGEGVPLGA